MFWLRANLFLDIPRLLSTCYLQMTRISDGAPPPIAPPVSYTPKTEQRILPSSTVWSTQQSPVSTIKFPGTTERLARNTTRKREVFPTSTRLRTKDPRSSFKTIQTPSNVHNAGPESKKPAAVITLGASMVSSPLFNKRNLPNGLLTFDRCMFPWILLGMFETLVRWTYSAMWLRRHVLGKWWGLWWR